MGVPIVPGCRSALGSRRLFQGREALNISQVAATASAQKGGFPRPALRATSCLFKAASPPVQQSEERPIVSSAARAARQRLATARRWTLRRKVHPPANLHTSLHASARSARSEADGIAKWQMLFSVLEHAAVDRQRNSFS